MWIELFKDVVAILKKGPKKRWEVIEEVKKGHKESNKTVDRILKALKDAKLIKESEDGRYEWIKEYQEFETMDERQAKRKHSEELIKTITKEELVDADYFFLSESNFNSKSFPYFLQHIETGYPDIFKLFNEYKVFKSQKEKAKGAFNKEIEGIISEKGFEFKESDLKEEGREVLRSVTFDVIDQYCSLDAEGKLKERIKLTLGHEGTKGVFDPIITCSYIARNENLKEEIEKVIETCIHTESVKTLYSELATVEKKEIDSFFKFESKIGRIIREIKLRKPLEGSCDACKFTIGRK